MINEIVEAIKNKGPSPGYHNKIMNKHKKEWPTLWAALDNLVNNYDSYIKKETMLKEAYDIIYNLSDDEECSLDHHGYCQTHRLEIDCSNKKANEWLEKYEELDND